MKMNDLLEKYKPFYMAEDGAGGGDDQVDSGDDAGADGDDTTNWFDGLNEDDQKFVEGRSAEDMVKYARELRSGVSKRADDVIKESGLIKPMTDEDDPIEFAKSYGRAAKTTDEYVSELGLEEGEVSEKQKVEMESAMEAGMSAKSYAKFIEAQKSKFEPLQEALAQKYAEEMKAEWGADAERNAQAIDRVAKELGWEGEEMLDFSGLSPKQAKGLTEKMLKLGEFMAEGGPIDGVGNDTSQAKSLEEQLTSVENEIIANGGVKTPEMERKHDEITRKMAELEAA